MREKKGTAELRNDIRERYKDLMDCIIASFRIHDPSSEMAQRVYELLHIEKYITSETHPSSLNVLEEAKNIFPKIASVNKVELAALRSLSIKNPMSATVTFKGLTAKTIPLDDSETEQPITSQIFTMVNGKLQPTLSESKSEN